MTDSTEDHNPDPTVVASAYLDGAATPAERARVESDPTIQAEVEQLRQVRAVLAATDPPPISAREEQLAAALGVWDRMSEGERSGDVTPTGAAAAGAASITTPPPTSLSSRRDRRGTQASKWMLGAAAAVLIVAAAGVVLRDVIGDTSTDDAAVEVAATEAPADRAQSEPEALEERALDEFLGNDAEEEFVPEDPDVATGGPVGTQAVDESLDAAATDAPAREPAAEAAEADGGADADIPAEGQQPAPPPDDDLEVLATPDDLADFGALAVRNRPPTTESPEFEPSFPTCPNSYDFEYILGPAIYQGVEVFVGVDADQGPGFVIAYDATCRLIESTPLP